MSAYKVNLSHTRIAPSGTTIVPFGTKIALSRAKVLLGNMKNNNHYNPRKRLRYMVKIFYKHAYKTYCRQLN
jgi:hypothetical protein